MSALSNKTENPSNKVKSLLERMLNSKHRIQAEMEEEHKEFVEGCRSRRKARPGHSPLKRALRRRAKNAQKLRTKETNGRA